MDTPAKFKTRHHTVEAVQFDGTNECAERIVNWSSGNCEMLSSTSVLPALVRVGTPDGWQTAEYSDWIVKDSGGFWVCHDEIFQRKYEPENA